jgi:2-desacetyl-2-hydroxyethyl bacteriochlorophyllide A dehydrogenase
MKALVTVDGGVVVAERPDPSPGRGEVVVAVHSCGICGSDLHLVRSGMMAPGSILGHEFAGRIVETGGDAGPWRTGQAVAVNPHGRCGNCPACHTALPMLCESGNLGLGVDGGFAEYVAAPVAQLRALPEEMDVELGSRVEPLAVALHALKLAEVAPGDAALVHGIGTIGLNVVLALRAAGAGTIVAVGRSEGRRAAAAALGADIVLDAREAGAAGVARYAAEAGLSFAHVFECSGAHGVVGELLPTLRTRGTLVEVALAGDPEPIDLRALVARNLRLIGSCAFGDAEFTRALDLIAAGRVDVGPLVSERVSLQDAPEAFRRLRDPKHLVGVLVQPWRTE